MAAFGCKAARLQGRFGVLFESDAMLKVADIFRSYQGTGLLSGIPQLFVRLAGCSVACPIKSVCDEPAALTSTGAVEMPEVEIVSKANDSKWLHITGGEPLEQDIRELVDLARAAGLRVHIQTSGGIPFDGADFVTVSPKQESIEIKPDELCLVASPWMNAGRAVRICTGHDVPVFVVPLSGGEAASAVAIVESLLSVDIDARLGCQSHLVWGVK